MGLRHHELDHQFEAGERLKLIVCTNTNNDECDSFESEALDFKTDSAGVLSIFRGERLWAAYGRGVWERVNYAD